MCRIVDSSVLGYLGEDSVGNGEFEKETGNSAREKEGDSEYVESEVDSLILRVRKVKTWLTMGIILVAQKILTVKGAKRKALKVIEGKAEDQYDQLWNYAQELKRSNPMSTIVMGFLTDCRPVIGVDGCHLKGPYGGILLTAVSVDPNNSLYPIAYVVVSGETKEAWEWFLWLLKADLGIERPDDFTFVSDKQKDLIPAFELVFLGAENRFCVRHLHENFKKAGFKGLAFKMALWNAAKATTVPEYELRMKEMGELDESAVEWFNDKPPSQWSRLTENRDRAAKRWYGKQICPKIRKIIEKNMDRSSDCIPIKSDDWNYEVKMCDNGDRFTVNLRTHSCSCRRWDMIGIPCSHAMSAIGCQDIEPYDYVHESYSVSTYLKRERPARARKLGVDEPRDKAKRGRGIKGRVRMKKQSFRVQCHYCGNPGHNQMWCKRRKADIAAGLTRDFAAPINVNVGSGTETGPFKKASTQKRKTNVENASNNDAGPSRKAPTQKRETNVEKASASCGVGASKRTKRTKKRKCAAEKETSAAKQASIAQSRKSSKKGKGQKATAYVSASGSAHGSVYETLQFTPSALMPKEGSQQPKLTARKRTFSEMANKSIAAPVLSKFRPPSAVMDPAPKTTPVPQPRVNIRCPPPFAPNHPNPILSQTHVANSQGGVPVLMKGGNFFVTMTNLSAPVAATSKGANKWKGRQPWRP
ncbi:hypothetical protein BUALT_Bualt03G0101700 [Buddleja alternifolia]|uniref:SWIM-type domain-containing protein n=1 Tax=Buddleja alternifolia TaxID=168488 RepID=A0AAV6Y100_9LAMI|nr:hypothetical protein BUALT_Bualt03G0101700 [Buddleja alternifolia]